jgi:hypothetical protein
MNIQPINPAHREEKSLCDKNIRYPVYFPGYDSPNGTTFFTNEERITSFILCTYHCCLTTFGFWILKSGNSCVTKSTSVDQVTWIIHEGGFLFIIYVYHIWYVDRWREWSQTPGRGKTK